MSSHANFPGASSARTLISDLPLGTRVSVRSLIENGQRATDAVGDIVERDGETVTVRTRRAGDVRVVVADVIAARVVPPPPQRPRPEK